MKVPLYIALGALAWRLKNVGIFNPATQYAVWFGLALLYVYDAMLALRANRRVFTGTVPEFQRYRFKQVAILNILYFATFSSELAVVSMLPLFFTDTFGLSPGMRSARGRRRPERREEPRRSPGRHAGETGRAADRRTWGDGLPHQDGGGRSSIAAGHLRSDPEAPCRSCGTSSPSRGAAHPASSRPMARRRASGAGALRDRARTGPARQAASVLASSAGARWRARVMLAHCPQGTVSPAFQSGPVGTASGSPARSGDSTQASTGRSTCAHLLNPGCPARHPSSTGASPGPGQVPQPGRSTQKPDNGCALCPLPSALCPLPSALCPLPSALCPLPSALCPLPSALCPLQGASRSAAPEQGTPGDGTAGRRQGRRGPSPCRKAAPEPDAGRGSRGGADLGAGADHGVGRITGRGRLRRRNGRGIRSG